MKAGTVIFCLLLLVLHLPISAQSYNFRNYTVDDGLISNETYYALQAQDGYLYVSSDRGLQRFDGQKFTTVPFSKASLNGSTIFNLYEDAKGMLWVSTYRQGLFYLASDTLRPHPCNPQILEIAGNSFVDQFFIDTSGHLYFTIINKVEKMIRININNQVDTLIIKNHFGFKQDRNTKQVYLKNEHLLVKRSFLNSEVPSSLNNFKSFSVQTADATKEGEFYPRCGPGILYKDSVLVGIRNVLVVYTKSGKHLGEYVFKDQILSILIDTRHNILLGTASGFYRIPPSGKVEHMLTGYVINGITQDKENGYWFTSTTHGVFYLPSFDIPVLSEGSRISCMKSYENRVVQIDFTSTLNIYHVEGSSVEKDTGFQVGNAYEDVYLDKELLGLHHQSYIMTGTSLRARNDSFPKARRYERLDDTAMLIAAYDGAYLCSLEDITNRRPLIDDFYFCTALCANNDFIYIGTDNGLIRYSRRSGKHQTVLPNLLNQRVSDLAVLNEKTVVIATKTNGLVLLDGTSYTHLTPDNSLLLSTGCNSVAVENDSTFWLGTDMGISKIKKAPSGYHCQNIGQKDGLVSQKVNDLAIAGQLLFIGTDAGSCYLNTQSIELSHMPIQLKTEIPVKDVERRSNDTLWLKTGVRNVMLQLSPISFRRTEHLNYSYTLNKEEAVYTESPVFYLNKLDPGTNAIHINVANSNGVWNAKPVSLTIIAPFRFYEKTMFRLTAFGLLFTLLFGLMNFYMRYSYNKRLRKWKFSTLQLRELNLQLNPHFIFNALNTIHHLALNGNRPAINAFISNFSKLTRKVLDNSKFKVIPLAEELKNIEDYVALEKLRFEGQAFDFEMEVPEKIDLNKTLIPPMILQPCVENAIWHGLLPKEGYRLLSLKIHLIKEGFKVFVKDNGIGLTSAKARKAHVHHKSSVGVSNTRLRLQLYEEMEMGRADFDLKEIFDIQGKSTGVTATFTFKPNQEKWNVP